MCATTADAEESSGSKSAPTPLKRASTDYYTQLTAKVVAIALPNGSPSTASGSQTGDLVRAAYDRGVRRGVGSYLNSPVMEQLALELTILRASSSAAEALT